MREKKHAEKGGQKSWGEVNRNCEVEGTSTRREILRFIVPKMPPDREIDDKWKLSLLNLINTLAYIALIILYFSLY